MPGCRERSSATAPRRNTRPPYTKTAIPNAAGMNWLPGKRGPGSPRMSWSPSENTSVGTVRIRLSQNLRRNCAGSWCEWSLVVAGVLVVVVMAGVLVSLRRCRHLVVLVVLVPAHASPPRLLFSS